MAWVAVAAAAWTAIPVQALDLSDRPSQMVHHTWSDRDGLPAAASWSVIQDVNGFVWVGTEGGLARYDGVHWKTYNAKNNDAFLADDVRSVATGENGDVWAAVLGGGLMRIRDGVATRFDDKDGLISNAANAVLVAANGDVWVGMGQGVCRRRAETIKCYDTEDGLVGGRIFRLAEDASGTIWFASLTEGVSAFAGGVFRTFTTDDGLATPQVFMLSPDPELNMVIGTYEGDLHAGTYEALVPVERGALPPGMVLLAGHLDAAGQFWIGTNADQGLWRFRPDVQRLDDPTEPVLSTFGLATDADGGLWAATASGAHRFAQGLFTPWGAPEGLSDGTFVVTEGPSGDIWAGSEGDGLFRLATDGVMSQWTRDEGLPVNSVSSLLAEQDGTLWVGTFGGGLVRLRDDRIDRILVVEDGLAANQVMALYRDSVGAVWVATAGGLCRMVDGQIERTLTVTDGLLANAVRFMAEDRQGRLLLVGDGGMTRLDVNTLAVVDTFNGDNGLADSLPTVAHIDARGIAWIGHRSGRLSRLEGGDVFVFSEDQGLRSDSITAIVEDGDGLLWLGGRRGIARVARDELDAVAAGNLDVVSVRAFRMSDGLRSARVPGGFQSPAVRARDGRIWMATTAGLTVVDPTQVQPLPSDLNVLIDEVRADGKRIAGTPDYVIPAGTLALEIDYTVPRVRDGALLEFRYRMAPGSARWQDAGSRRTAFFTSLPPRSSVFEVVARHPDGRFPSHADAASRISLYVEPVWHQTVVFRALMAVLAGTLLWALYRWALQRHRHRNKRLEVLVDERTRALRRALAQVEQMSLTDVLTGVANRRHFEERIMVEWQRAVETGAPISVMMIDIDHFKQFNDVAGHQAGDDCLSAVARALSSSVRGNDFIARYGGEEFAVLLTGSDVEATRQIGQRIQRSVRDLNMPHPGRPPGSLVTVSAGFATAEPGVIDSAAELMKLADDALYRAKELGRDRVFLARDLARSA